MSSTRAGTKPSAGSGRLDSIHMRRELLDPPKWLQWLFLCIPFFAAAGAFLTLPTGQLNNFCVYCFVAPATGIYAAYILLRYRRPAGTGGRLAGVLALAIIVWGALSYFWAFDPTSAINEGNRTFRPMLSLFGITYLALVYKGLYRRLINGVMLAFVASLVIVLFDRVTGKHFTEIMGVPWIFPIGTVTSFFYNPNNYSAFLTLIATLVLIYTARNNNWKQQVAAYLVLGVIMAVTFETGSRSGVLGLGLMAFVVMMTRGVRNRFKNILRVALTLVGVAVVGYFAARSRVDAIVASIIKQVFASDEVTQGSDQYRLTLSERGIAYFLDSGLMGNGAGSYTSMVANDGNVPYGKAINAHNVFVEVGAQYGLVVLVPLLLVFLFAVRECIRRNPPLMSAEDCTKRDELRLLSMCLLLSIGMAGVVQSSVFADFMWWLQVSLVLIATQFAKDSRLGATHV